MKNYTERFGIIWGFIFFGISILMTATFILPIYIGYVVEKIGTLFNMIIKADSIGKSTYFICVLVLSIVIILYIVAYLKTNNFKILDTLLIILFLTILIFLNSALFYIDWFKPNFRIDGQQSFNMIVKPLLTCWIYPIIGFIHYLKFKVAK